MNKDFLKVNVHKRCFRTVTGHDNFGMAALNDNDIVKPFTAVPTNPIHTMDFLQYVANHQDKMEQYKDEYQVRSQSVATKQLFMISVHSNSYLYRNE